MTLQGSIRQIGEHTIAMTLAHEGRHIGTVHVSSNVALRANPTAMIAGFLPVAAKMGYDLRIENSVDTIAAANTAGIIDKLASWDRTLQPSRLVDTPTESGMPFATGVACLASLGLDSFYSMHTRQDVITHLVLCHGFDIGLGNTGLWQQTIDNCRALAAAGGKQLIEVTTDIRKLADPYLSWTKQFHGAALASFAHLLDQHFARLIIPSSFTDDADIQWGSHSQLDPLWSSSRLTFEHHELGVDRVQKLSAIADNPYAMKYLRVCVQDLPGVYNCGQCEKCIRTMCGAVAAGVADQLETLPPITAELIRGVSFRRPTCVQYHRENLAHLRELPASKRRPDLESAIEERLDRYAAESA